MDLTALLPRRGTSVEKTVFDFSSEWKACPPTSNTKFIGYEYIPKEIIEFEKTMMCAPLNSESNKLEPSEETSLPVPFIPSYENYVGPTPLRDLEEIAEMPRHPSWMIPLQDYHYYDYSSYQSTQQIDPYPLPTSRNIYKNETEVEYLRRHNNELRKTILEKDEELRDVRNQLHQCQQKQKIEKTTRKKENALLLG